MTDPAPSLDLLPGIPADKVAERLARSPGSEFSTGKFTSPESSAALAVNAFGWFIDRAKSLPAMAGVPMGAPETIEIEAEMRLPWRGGPHPWLDAVVSTATTMVGIESTRYEPFRPRKANSFPPNYDEYDWGEGMARYTSLRLALTSGKKTYRHLDAVQLVKLAFGMKVQGTKRGRGAVLVYLHAAPDTWANGKALDRDSITRHAAEAADFARAVKGDDVVFMPMRWADLLDQWAKKPDLAPHVKELHQRFGTV